MSEQRSNQMIEPTMIDMPNGKPQLPHEWRIVHDTLTMTMGVVWIIAICIGIFTFVSVRYMLHLDAQGRYEVHVNNGSVYTVDKRTGACWVSMGGNIKSFSTRPPLKDATSDGE